MRAVLQTQNALGKTGTVSLRVASVRIAYQIQSAEANIVTQRIFSDVSNVLPILNAVVGKLVTLLQGAA